MLNILSRGQLCGEGSYAAVWAHRGTALKFTCDKATISLSQLLWDQRVPGLPEVHNVLPDAAWSHDNIGYDAVVLEALVPLPAARFQALERCYQAARAVAQSRYRRVTNQSVVLADTMAASLPGLRTKALDSYNLAQLAEAMAWLARFFEATGYCADFGARRNWMLNRSGEVVLSDPVVARIRALDARCSRSS